MPTKNSSQNRIAVVPSVGLPEMQPQASIAEIIFRIEEGNRSLKPLFSMFAFSKGQFKRVQGEIDQIVDVGLALPNGKGRSSTLSSSEVEQLRLDLIAAAGFACSLVGNRQLKNLVPKRGRPADNITFVFIDDLMQACLNAGLKPGRRFVTGSQSLPVRLYIALAPIVGFGNPKNPRKLFERWHRLAPDLRRKPSGPN